ncbi:proline synthase co-transcribed bacterial homolog protein-like, partial [Phalaenopsis equestris]|uniref:proline synthase co-transcribed bacterial homolog protein-like n=1 Tax=Phalaenopsis equestris TaxID=78828 RepID=UPI0009E570D1
MGMGTLFFNCFISFEHTTKCLFDNFTLFKQFRAAKSGVEPSDCVALAKHVKQNCPNLVFSGLMTIGRPDYTSSPENFQVLSSCKDEVCKELGMPECQCELSMGMSGDFEKAIEMGSTNVRIGSTI